MTMDNLNPCAILVVEDDEGIGEMLVETLTDEGYQTARVKHGQAALDYLQRAPTLPCLILLDLMMPVMTGQEFRFVQQQHPVWRHIPVVVLSAMGSRLQAQELAQLNALDYIPKPIDWNCLEQAILQCCPS